MAQGPESAGFQMAGLLEAVRSPLRCSPRQKSISAWPQYPTLYEINTWVWLSELSLKTGTSVDLEFRALS